MPLAGLPRCIDRKRWKTLTERFASRLEKVAGHPKGGSKLIETAGKAIDAFREFQQVFGDAFICAGYLLGHLHGLELNGAEQAPQAKGLLSQDPQVAELMVRLERVLHQLYLSEFAWHSIEVFALISPSVIPSARC